MTSYTLDSLYTWQQVSPERQACAPEGYEVNLTRVAWQATASEVEALRLWLADGGDLDCAFLSGLKIIVGEEKEVLHHRLRAENVGHSVVFTRSFL